MNCVRTSKESCDLVRVEGDVDLATSPELRNLLREVLEKDRRSVVLDLAQVPHMDSSGIAVLIEGERWARKYGLKLLLASPSRQVRMVLELARLETFFTIADDVDGALELCEAG